MSDAPQERPRGRRPTAQPGDRTPARVLGVAGVVGLMIVLFVSIGLILGAGDGDDEVAAGPAATATATATPEKTPKPKPTPPPLSAAERAERDAAIAIVESRGFTAERPKDWDPDADLKVLIGTDTDGGQLAFFFVNGDYLGNDSTETSGRLRVRRSDGLEVTLAYGIYEPGDELGKPTGEPVPITFVYDGASVEPQQSLPLINERSQPVP